MFITSLYSVADLDEMKNSGIGAVVVGSTSFSIGAVLSLEMAELENCIVEAHKLGLLVYVLCNTMIFDEDIEDLRLYLRELERVNADAVYYSDVAVYQLAKELEMTEKLIFAPGFIIVNTPDAKAYLEQGIKQVELANELTLAEKCQIAKTLGEKLQVVIHGYLLMSYSRREFLSNYFTESGIKLAVKNDREYYLVEETRENPMPILESAEGTVIYSPYILESFTEIKELFAAGITDFRLEGLFLKKDYLLAAVKAYQNILSGADIEEVKTTFKVKYPYQYQESGFYYQKTNLVKQNEQD